MNIEMNRSLYWIWITTIKGLKKSRIKQLLNYCKSPENIWNESRKELRLLFNLSDQELALIDQSKNPLLLKKWIRDLESRGIFYYSIDDSNYPHILKNIPDPPLGIYVKGKVSALDKRFLAIVGTRRCSEYGRRAARKLAEELSYKGFGIISGLAQGIDTEAHKATIEAEGMTAAVVAHGLDLCYPASNEKLMDMIEEKGVIVSEHPPGRKPIPGLFPARNRIISGLSEGVIIIEAGEKSGALITADLALEQGKEVFAVPGSIFSSNSKGAHHLIQQGAKLVMNVDDILNELDESLFHKCSHRCSNELLKYKDKIIDGLAIEENLVYDCISFDPSHIDVLSSKIHYPINKLQGILTLLELKGLIQQLPGKRFIRNQ